MWNRNLTRAAVRWLLSHWLSRQSKKKWKEKKSGLHLLNWMGFGCLPFQWMLWTNFSTQIAFNLFLCCAITFLLTISNFNFFYFVLFCFYRWQFLLSHFVCMEWMEAIECHVCKIAISQSNLRSTNALRTYITYAHWFNRKWSSFHFFGPVAYVFPHVDCKSAWEFKSAPTIFLFSLFRLLLAHFAGCECWIASAYGNFFLHF